MLIMVLNMGSRHSTRADARTEAGADARGHCGTSAVGTRSDKLKLHYVTFAIGRIK